MLHQKRLGMYNSTSLNTFLSPLIDIIIYAFDIIEQKSINSKADTTTEQPVNFDGRENKFASI